MNIQNLKSYSQAGQDIFATWCNSFAKNGFYLELGSNEAFAGNNSALLEQEFDYKGLSVEYVGYLCDSFNRQRKNPCFNYDLNHKSLTEILDENSAPTVISYMSHDVDHPHTRINSIKTFDFNKYKVKSLTFEHDAYLDGPTVQEESQEFLQSNGMTLVIENVMFGGRKFEDWYVDINLVNEELWKPLIGKDVEYTEILNRMV